MEKYCIKCEVEKDISEFSRNKSNKDGLCGRCKECEKQRAVEYRTKNPEKQKESSKKWRIKNPEKQRESYKKYIEKNPHMHSTIRLREQRKNEEYNKKINEKKRQFYAKNADRLREERRVYYFENKSEERRRNNEWKKNKRKSDPIYRIKLNIRARIRDYLKGSKIGKRTFEIIGLTPDEFKKHIESNFTNGMTWENYGDWHVDHKRPLCLAKTEEEILMLNHYTNLQPLWGIDNIRKNRKYDN